MLIWVAYANFFATQKQFDEAFNKLDEAQKTLGGDPVELRLERAKVSIAEGGPLVAAKLNALGHGIDGFSKEDRARVLSALALNLYQLQHYPEAGRFWSRLAELEPNSLDCRVGLFDVALQTADTDEIEHNIRKIKEIQGIDGSTGRRCEINYLIWQAHRAWTRILRKLGGFSRRRTPTSVTWIHAVRTGLSCL